MGDLRDELTALGRMMLARTNALADRVAVLERRAGLVPLEDADPPARNDAALAAAVSRAWSVLDSAVDGYPAGYAWLHDAVREARDAVGEIGELLRAERATEAPPIKEGDAVRFSDGSVGVAIRARAGDGDVILVDPPTVTHYFGSDALRTELAKLQRATLTLGAHVPREFGPLYDAAQDAKAAAFAVGELVRWGVPQPEPGPGPVTTEILMRHAATDPPRPPGAKVVELPTAPAVTPDAALAVMVGLDRGAEDDDDDPSPWRPLPDPECPEDEPVWLTSRFRGHVDAEVAIQRRNGSGALRWYTYGDRDSGEVIAEALAWMPLPEPWRGGD